MTFPPIRGRAVSRRGQRELRDGNHATQIWWRKPSDDLLTPPDGTQQHHAKDHAQDLQDIHN